MLLLQRVSCPAGNKKGRHMGFCKKTEGPGGGPEPGTVDFSAHQLDGVETYSGSRLHERPRHFTFRGERLEVTRVLASWREPAILAFIVLAHDFRRFLLKYHQLDDVWVIQIWPGCETSRS
jgi:hypothetical protein